MQSDFLAYFVSISLIFTKTTDIRVRGWRS
ncbi:hypothetical protein PSP6_230072 [Paraburkholderia tropica]|nr:hypothetical protein PSP6_230072 [Paraburkholderia tropica]